jgi:isoleucyl-tRNA synthetase
MFKPVGSRVNFPEAEEKILELWKDKKIFGRSVEQRQGKPRFVFYEGPPFANGNPGIHHVLARIFKDVIIRYRVMKGYYVPRIAGWDTHGLPVELEIERALGFSGKEQIEQYGVERFNERCRESVFRYLKEWNKLTERIAYWVDLEKAYMTMSNDYIETVWWAIKRLWDKGLIYQGYRVTPHCPRCGTSLSSHEVALGYEDADDPSVYIKFKAAKSSKLPSDKPVYLLAWTTTPWTLPGNTALAVAADAEYAVLEGEKDYLIMAVTLVGAVGLEGYKAIKRLKGRDLVGAEYEPLFNPHDFGVERRLMTEGLPLQKATKDLRYRVIATDFVSLDEGTGIVHMAPAYGEVDYEAGLAEKLDFVHTVDLQGNVIGNYPFSGRFVKDADPMVLKELEKKGLLFRSETIRHTYPFCWRCDTPLLYYAKQTWYIRTTAVKEDLIARNDEINWYPEHIKYGRFGNWLENNIDWAFSRERYWGTPLPIWRCQSCGAYEGIGGIQELKDKPGFSGFKEPLDLHRPFVDELTFDCPKCGAKMQRVSEVIDCWFDSGAMPIAQHHYPFENETLLKDGRFPADYISEAVDQTRGWFYSLHAISTLLFNRRCYSNVICLGLVLDAKGEKMSKTKGNIIEPWAVINKYGVDALRWYFFTSTAAGNVYRFDESMVAEVSRRFLSTLWNVYSFFVTYANIDKFTPEKAGAKSELSELDRWILSELNQLIADVDSGLENYNPTEAGRKIEAFVDELSNWYVRRSRRRFWKSESDADKMAAYNTLYECLVTLAKLLAPFTPFVAEAMYRNLVGSVAPDAPESVHLADFPVADKAKIDKQLSEDIKLAMKVSSMGRAARTKAGIKVRQPLAKVVVGIPSGQERRSLRKLKLQIAEELNVKDVVICVPTAAVFISVLAPEVVTEGDHSVKISKKIPPKLQMEGVAREIVRRLQTMRRSAGFDIADHIVTFYQGDDYIKKVMSNFADYIKQETLSRELVDGAPAEGAFTESHKLSGHEITLGVKRLG